MLESRSHSKGGLPLPWRQGVDLMNCIVVAENAVIVTKSVGESFGNLLSIQNLNQ